MDCVVNNKALGTLLTKCDLGISPKIVVTGSSMNPSLLNGDEIILEQADDYSAADIVLFHYNENEYIIHRIVYKDNNIIICKGDNSFRLEYIKFESIIGMVNKVIRNNEIIEIPSLDERYLDMSYKIGLLVEKNNHNIKQCILSDLYKQYYDEYLKRKND